MSYQSLRYEVLLYVENIAFSKTDVEFYTEKEKVYFLYT